jgi:hypothetical protein
MKKLDEATPRKTTCLPPVHANVRIVANELKFRSGVSRVYCISCNKWMQSDVPYLGDDVATRFMVQKKFTTVKIDCPSVSTNTDFYLVVNYKGNIFAVPWEDVSVVPNRPQRQHCCRHSTEFPSTIPQNQGYVQGNRRFIISPDLFSFKIYCLLFSKLSSL